MHDFMSHSRRKEAVGYKSLRPRSWQEGESTSAQYCLDSCFNLYKRQTSNEHHTLRIRPQIHIDFTVSVAMTTK